MIVSGSSLAEDQDLESKINKLNTQSVVLLGVSLNALAYLVDASPTSFIPIWHLEKSGDINFVRELEVAGYVRTEVVQGLPDGQERNEKFMRIIPLELGREAQQYLLALKQHNKQIQPTPKSGAAD